MSGADDKSGSIEVPITELVGIEARLTTLRVSRDRWRGEDTHPSQRETRIRVRASLINIEEEAPSDLRIESEGARIPAGADLAVATAALRLAGRLRPQQLAGRMLLAELSLGGDLRPLRGLLPRLFAAAQAGYGEVLVSRASAAELVLPSPIPVRVADHLGEVLAYLRGERELPLAKPVTPTVDPCQQPDLSDIRGLREAKRALEIAAVGGHSLLLVGPPGAGKTLLARRLGGLLPPPEDPKREQLASIRSAAGQRPLAPGERPFRAPHHTASEAAIFGGGAPIRPGEITLAHGGVLFLDELTEFPKSVRERLPGVLKAGTTTVIHQRRRLEMPARPLLVATMNPCPCGWGEGSHLACARCPERTRFYQKRIGPQLRSLFDLQITLGVVDPRTQREAPRGESSAEVAARVQAARAFGAERGELPLVDAGRRELLRIHDPSHQCRVRQVAQTLARMERAEALAEHHIAEAQALVPEALR